MALESLLELTHKIRMWWLIKRGLKLGANCYIVRSAIIDGSFPWLISIGDNTTITCNVIILAHDASTKRYLGYSKIGAVIIGKNCFIGAGTIILPNVHIGNNVTIGAGSVVTRNIPDDQIAAGNPARIVGNAKDFVRVHSAKMQASVCYPGKGWTEGNGITEEHRKIMWDNVKDKMGYIE